MMSKFKIKLELEKLPDEKITGFSRGHFTIEGTNGIISSRDSYSLTDQSVMIMLSITLLLDSIRYLTGKQKEDSYNFVGVDSSFQFILKKQDNYISIYKINGEIIEKLPTDKFVAVVWNEIQRFIKKSRKYISKNDPTYDDFHNSVKAFQKHFHLSDLKEG